MVLVRWCLYPGQREKAACPLLPAPPALYSKPMWLFLIVYRFPGSRCKGRLGSQHPAYLYPMMGSCPHSHPKLTKWQFSRLGKGIQCWHNSTSPFYFVIALILCSNIWASWIYLSLLSFLLFWASWILTGLFSKVLKYLVLPLALFSL